MTNTRLKVYRIYETIIVTIEKPIKLKSLQNTVIQLKVIQLTLTETIKLILYPPNANPVGLS